MSATAVVRERPFPWLGLSWMYAAAVVGLLGYFLLRIPIQVTDSFWNLVALDRPFWELMREQVLDPEYLRPGLWAALKIVYDLADGDYFHWFRVTQVVQVALTVGLFVWLLQPRSRSAAAVLPLALAVLVGVQTFAWTVREAFPINTFLTIVVCCAAAANLSFARPRWWIDAAAVALFVFSALTVESGLLVGVIVIGGFLLGLRGVSRAGVAAVTALLAGYFVARFFVLDVGVPGLTTREAGFGFSRRGGEELVRLFGDNALGFYLYNVTASVLNVLVAEPRDGVWRLVRGLVSDGVEAPFLIGVVSSTLATALIGRFVWRRRRAWLALELGRDDRLVLLFGLVLAANAAMCYAYTKDVIMSPAGFFYAAAVFVGARDLVDHPPRGTAGLVLGLAVVAALSTLWSVRAVGLHAALAASAGQVRQQWAYVDQLFAEQGNDDLSPREQRLKRQLQDDAVVRHPARPAVRQELVRWFEVD